MMLSYLVIGNKTAINICVLSNTTSQTYCVIMS